MPLCLAAFRPLYQYENIKNSSTTHALIHLIHHWLVALEIPGNSIKSCMIDFSKAFDRVDHNNVPSILLNWCANFPEHRYFRLKMGKIKSYWKEINAGVPQGTIHAPLFFLIMINDLTTTLPLYTVSMQTITLHMKSFPGQSIILCSKRTSTSSIPGQKLITCALTEIKRKNSGYLSLRPH